MPQPAGTREPPDTDTSAISHTKLLKWGLLGSVITALLPLHVWGAYHFSFRTLLYGYAFAVVGAFYGIAAIVLLLGVMVPPIMLVHWVWEVWNEPVPAGAEEYEQQEEAANGQALAEVVNDE